MTASNFQACLKRVLVSEGGKVDNPKDPGGRTNQGITQRTYNAYRRNLGKPVQDVYLMVSVERDEIYRLQYWDAIHGNDLPEGVDYIVFDFAVNAGPAAAARLLQAAIGVSIDAKIGQMTIDAVKSDPDNDRLIARYTARKMAYYRSLKPWPTFGRGWTLRADQVRIAAQAMASGSVGPKPVFIERANIKARPEDAKSVPSMAMADASTGGGVVTATLSQTVEALTPLTDRVQIIGTTVALLTAVGGLIAVAGVLYRVWATRRAATLADALALPSPAQPAPAVEVPA